jgi:hypothetical protein
MKHEDYEDKVNENCLAQMRCPWCFSAGPFNIVCKTWVEMHDNGSEKHEDLDHDADSNARCLNHPCEWHGTVGDLYFAFELIERMKADVITGVPVITEKTLEIFLRDVKKDFTIVADEFGGFLQKKNPILLEAIKYIAMTMERLAKADPESNDAKSNALLGAFCAVKIIYNQVEVDQVDAVKEV